MIIIKIGGGTEINLEETIKDLSNLNEEFIIVHGANALRDELAQRLNYEKRIVKSVKGYSSVFTDDEGIDIMMMAYSGLRNKRLVELCQRYGINGIGLTGLDGQVIRGKRNSGIKIREDGKLKLLRDNSGKPKSINTDLIKLLLNNDYVPVLTVPILDENGKAINSENDDIVALLQNELQADKVIQLIEAPGYLKDIDDPASVIKEISKSQLIQMEENSEGRMKRKLLALRKLFESNNPTVYIADGRREAPVTNALNGGGTIIQ